MPRYDLIAFDVDGTLVRHPKDWTVWEVLNDRFTGTPEVNAERYAAYRQGTLSYADWVALDVGGWRDAGARREDLIEAFGSLELVPGTRSTLEKLREAGSRLIVISGTLDLMLRTLLPRPPFDEIYANHIGFDGDGCITHWRATPFDMDGKATALRAVAMRESIPLRRCAFVGDSDNDRWVAETAGFTLAFNPKSEAFAAVADAIVRDLDLGATLKYLI